jgi:hypothetical protein
MNFLINFILFNFYENFEFIEELFKIFLILIEILGFIKYFD